MSYSSSHSHKSDFGLHLTHTMKFFVDCCITLEYSHTMKECDDTPIVIESDGASLITNTSAISILTLPDEDEKDVASSKVAVERRGEEVCLGGSAESYPNLLVSTSSFDVENKGSRSIVGGGEEARTLTKNSYENGYKMTGNNSREPGFVRSQGNAKHKYGRAHQGRPTVQGWLQQHANHITEMTARSCWFYEHATAKKCGTFEQFHKQHDF